MRRQHTREQAACAALGVSILILRNRRGSLDEKTGALSRRSRVRWRKWSKLPRSSRSAPNSRMHWSN